MAAERIVPLDGGLLEALKGRQVACRTRELFGYSLSPSADAAITARTGDEIGPRKEFVSWDKKRKKECWPR